MESRRLLDKLTFIIVFTIIVLLTKNYFCFHTSLYFYYRSFVIDCLHPLNKIVAIYLKKNFCRFFPLLK